MQYASLVTISMNSLAVISDIHGNYPALKSVLSKIDELGIDDIICLGDVVGYYCQINDCIDELRSRNIHTLLGNHDYYMLGGTCCYSKTVRICIDYQKTIIRHDNYEWLKTLSPAYDNDRSSFRHGGWDDALEERVEVFDFSMVSSYNQLFYFSGHTHKQIIQLDEKSGKVFCNPGSVGQPRDDDPRAAFVVLLPDGRLETYRVEYDIDAIVNKMKEANQGDWIWRGLYTGEKVGGNIYKESAI